MSLLRVGLLGLLVFGLGLGLGGGPLGSGVLSVVDGLWSLPRFPSVSPPGVRCSFVVHCFVLPSLVVGEVSLYLGWLPVMSGFPRDQGQFLGVFPLWGCSRLEGGVLLCPVDLLRLLCLRLPWVLLPRYSVKVLRLMVGFGFGFARGGFGSGGESVIISLGV